MAIAFKSLAEIGFDIEKVEAEDARAIARDFGNGIYEIDDGNYSYVKVEYDEGKRLIARLREKFPDQFAKREFDDSRDAYDASQCDGGIGNGDMLIVPDEEAIALAWAWPVAISANAGGFHAFSDPKVFEEFAERHQLEAAIAEAKARGWPIAEGLEQWLAGKVDWIKGRK